jgi:membrane protease YdiL (CAAX protease family)
MEVFATPLEDTPRRLIGEIQNTLMFAVMVSSVALVVLAVAALVWRRPMTDFLWPKRRFSLRQFGVGFMAMFAVSACWIPVNLMTGSELRPPILDAYYSLDTRILYLLAMPGAVLIGAAAEEVIFRGVLLRVTGLILRRPVLLCLINGLLFSAIHLDPDPVSFVIRAISGMGYTWIALRLGGLEFPIGAHFANNVYIALVWAPFSSGYEVRESNWLEVVPELIITVAVVILVEWLTQQRWFVSRSKLSPELADQSL